MKLYVPLLDSPHKSKFLAKLDAIYFRYRDKIVSDFDMTGGAAHQMTALVRATVRLDAEREQVFQSVLGTIGLDDTILQLPAELNQGLLPPRP